MLRRLPALVAALTAPQMRAGRRSCPLCSYQEGEAGASSFKVLVIDELVEGGVAEAYE